MNVLLNDPCIAVAYRQVVVQDLGRLNELESGLGDKAAAYVLTGVGGNVLSSIATLVTDQLEAGHSWANYSSTDERRRLLALAHPYDVQLMQRYVEVLSAPVTALPSAVGTRNVPAKVRVFFTEAFIGLNRLWTPAMGRLQDQGLILEKALQMLQGLEGTPADFVDVLYTAEGQWAVSGSIYRQAEELGAWFGANAAATADAMARIPAVARVELLNDLLDWGVASHGSFTELLVRQAGDGSKAVHEAAVAALACAPPAQVETAATQLLATGDVTQRSSMVDLLARLPLPGAGAALAAHREKEQVARIRTAIDAALPLVEQRGALSGADSRGLSYTAIDGRSISIPQQRALQDGPVPRFGDADASALAALIAVENQEITQRNASNSAHGWHPQPLLDPTGAASVVAFLNGEGEPPAWMLQLFLASGKATGWLSETVGRLPDSRAIPLLRGLGTAGHILTPSMYGLGRTRMDDYLLRSDADLRTLEALDVAAHILSAIGTGQKQHMRPAQKGDFLRTALHDGHWYHAVLGDIPQDALWPYLAENLAVLDEAFGLAPSSGVPLDRATALQALAHLPAVPARYYSALLEIGVGEVKSGREQARALLASAPDLEGRLIDLLADSRQTVRAAAAQWLAARGAAGAAGALQKRLKSEKSERVRAAFLTALATLGEDISKELGPDALLAEARQGLKTVKGEKLSFLRYADLPTQHYRDGKEVPVEVLRWWCELAVKLKQPGGVELFGIYLDQLAPSGAEAFSVWVLDSWLAYDTVRPGDEEAAAYAKANVPDLCRTYPFTDEQAFAYLRAQCLADYSNSGAESKGVLALAVRTPPTQAAERVRAYLRAHGARTSQAGALLELLAGIGDPVALQVLIAASLRLKQKSLQKLAGELITAIAQRRDWTLDELADRTVPAAGFDSEGILVLPCGADQKPYEARLGHDLAIKLRNPAGNEIASLPAGEDALTKDSKKQLSAARKALKEIIALQTRRLYEALCAQRSWTSEDWRGCFHAHPVMRRLIQLLVWVGVDQHGDAGTFRPTAEGDFIGPQDQPVDVTALREIRLASGAVLGEAVGKAWLQHLNDYEVVPLFRQFGREILKLSAEDGEKTVIEDRKGWISDAFTFRGAATKLGYERGPVLDGGTFKDYRKTFQSVGLAAVVSLTANSLPLENVPTALKGLSFEKVTALTHRGGDVKLAEVPAVLLSECWNDYHVMASKAAYDPEWAKRFPW